VPSASSLQWSRRRSTAEMRRRRTTASPPSGFNGAAVDRRRKSVRDCGTAPRSRASMEPPSIDGGNGGSVAGSIGALAGLQWSRRRSTAEMLIAREDPGVLEEASMEPPSIDGGNGGLLVNFSRRLVASMEPPSIDGGNS